MYGHKEGGREGGGVESYKNQLIIIILLAISLFVSIFFSSLTNKHYIYMHIK